MSKIENEAMVQLLSHINEKKCDSYPLDTKKKKNVSDGKNCCTAAVKYNTIGNAYKDIQDKVNVYLVKDDKNGSFKTNAYARCSKTKQDGGDFCHLHCRMIKCGSKSLKVFDKDIIPLSSDDKLRWLARTDDDFFENMGKRGAKKKHGENNYTFSDDKHPILLILTHKNAKLATQLSIYASQLLKGNYDILPNIESVKAKNVNVSVKTESVDNNLSNLMSMISLIENKKALSEQDSDEENSSEEDSDEEDSDEEEEKSLLKSISPGEESSSPEEDPEEGVSCIPINTNNGKLLWFDQESKIIYEPEGEDGGEEIGILKEISNEYHTILYNKKLYTVLKEIDGTKKGTVFCCVLTNSLFDKNNNFIGTRTKLKGNTYRFDFN